MKLFTHSIDYGGRIGIQIQWSNVFYFDSNPPVKDKLILLDFPGLESDSIYTIQEWISKQNKNLKNLNIVPNGSWRYAKLSDFMEAYNYQTYFWWINKFFSIEEINSFIQKEVPKTMKELNEAVSIADKKEKQKSFSKLHTRLWIIANVFYQSPNKVKLEIDQITKELENKILKNLEQQKFVLKNWLEQLNVFSNIDARQNGMTVLAEKMVSENLDLYNSLLEIDKYNVLRNYIDSPSTPFWNVLTPHIKFPSNCIGETIDLSEAEEIPVVPCRALFNAKRIGNIVIGRRALMVRDKKRNPIAYIRGEKKLLFKIQNAGGQVSYKKNTLTFNKKQSDLTSLKLEIEKIVTLSHIDPEKAIALLPQGAVSQHHFVYDTAKMAKSDFKQAEILSDVLIELITGIDPDVVKRL